MNGRNFLDLALLVPGVSPTNIGSTQLFAETSAVPGQGISIASQRNLSNNFIVDGCRPTTMPPGLSGITYGVDAVEQFQVVTSGGQAELGRALGGYVNVVTKSGTNALHGTLYDFFRDDTFNAPNALSGTTLPMDQQQYGGSLGGPLARNRTFYFANVERRCSIRPGSSRSLPENVPRHQRQTGGRSAIQGLNRDRHLSQSGAQRERLGKIDHQFSGSPISSRAVRALHVTSTTRAAPAPECADRIGRARQRGPVARDRQHVDDLVEHGQRDAGAVAHGDLKAPPTDQIGPAGQHRGRRVLRHVLQQPDAALNTMYPGRRTTLSHQAGAHALRAGVDFLFNDDTITFPRSFRGSYTFSSMANFLTGNYSGFTQTFGDPVVSQTNPNIGVYRAGRVARRIEPDAEPRPALRPAIPRHRSTPTPTTCRRGRVRVVAVGVAGSRRPRQRGLCSSIGCRSAPSPMRSCPLATRPT